MPDADRRGESVSDLPEVRSAASGDRDHSVSDEFAGLREVGASAPRMQPAHQPDRTLRGRRGARQGARQRALGRRRSRDSRSAASPAAPSTPTKGPPPQPRQPGDASIRWWSPPPRSQPSTSPWEPTEPLRQGERPRPRLDPPRARAPGNHPRKSSSAWAPADRLRPPGTSADFRRPGWWGRGILDRVRNSDSVRVV
jgi:hypothetical protein